MRKITQKEVITIRIKKCSSKTELLEKIKEKLKNLPETAVVRGFQAQGIATLWSRWEE